MAGAWFYSILSVVIVSLISLVSIFFLSIKHERLSKILLVLVSFATGALFGDVFIHLLPEIAEDFGFTLVTSFSILAGLLVFFIIEKFVQGVHCHDPHHHHTHPVGITNLVGDGLHNFIDGMLIAGSYLASFELGIATTIAVLLHEIPQEIGDFAILLHAGFKRAKAMLFNFFSAITAIAGALVVLAADGGSQTLSLLLPFTAGGFLYIAGADLLPELHKAKYSFKTSAIQLLAMVLGMLVMYGLVFLE